MRNPVARPLWKRALIITVSVGVCLVLVHIVLVVAGGAYLRKQIREQAQAAGSEWYEPDSTRITFDPWRGDLLIEDLQWVPSMQHRARSVHVSGRMDSLQVQGLSLYDLLVKDRARVASVVLRLEDINVALLAQDTTKKRDIERALSVEVGHLDIRLQRTRFFSTDSMRMELEGCALLGRAFVTESGDELHPIRCEGVRAHLDGMRCAPFADSVLHIARMDWNGEEGKLSMENASFGPSEVVRAATALAFERDALHGEFPEVSLHGLETSSILNGKLNARTLLVRNARLKVARDKLLPDEELRYMALPAHLLRKLPPDCGLDSVVVDNLSVTYYERGDASKGFAKLPFDTIMAVATNLRNSAPVDSAMVLHARAIAFEHTPIDLTISTVAADTTDVMVVRACVGRLPFTKLDLLMTRLAGIGTEEGVMDTLIMHMRGGDVHADARVWMRYNGLKLGMEMEKTKVLEPLLSGLVNAMVKRERTGERDDDGWTYYAWQRDRDRSVWNYLWSSLRTGARESVMRKGVIKELVSR